MKILTKQEEQEHYNATVTGGLLGGAVGLAAGGAGVFAATQRFPAFRGLTLPFRAFLVVSTGTFAAIISADTYSRRYESSRHPEQQYTDEQTRSAEQLQSQKGAAQRAKEWASDNRYGIVFGSWVVSMGAALGIVSRNRYLTGQQKLVQARVYAQGLTLAVIVASLALEGKDMNKGVGRWETVKVLDPNDPSHKHLIEKKVHHERYSGEDQWMDMVEAEEEKMKEREQAVKSKEKEDANKSKKSDKHSEKKSEKGDSQKSEKGDSQKSEKGDSQKSEKGDSQKSEKGDSKKSS